MTTPTRKRTTLPYFQFYPKDFLSSTKVQRMSYAEVGVYTILLSRCWLDDGLPGDIDTLARVLKIPARQFHKMWSGPLGECFTLRRGRYINERLEQAAQDYTDYLNKQAENGKKGGRPKKAVGYSEQSQEKAVGFSGETQTKPNQKPSTALAIAPAISKEQEHARSLDLDWADFVKAYPAQGRTLSRFASELFLKARQSGVSLQTMLDALSNHKASDQWSVAGKIPNLSKWLEEQRWNVVLAPPKAQRPAGGYVPTVRPPWECPHVDPCDSRHDCDVRAMLPEKYPVKVIA